MTSRWLELLEAHVEKGILGVAGLFMVGMLWMYLIRSPNTAEYQGQERGPRELMEAIKSDSAASDAAKAGHGSESGGSRAAAHRRAGYA